MTEEHIPFEKPAFTRVHLNTDEDIVSIRLNEQERAELREIKDMLRLDADGTAFKFCVTIAKNVLQSVLGKELVRFLTSPRRLRPGRKD